MSHDSSASNILKCNGDNQKNVYYHAVHAISVDGSNGVAIVDNAILVSMHTVDRA
jgi:hypothetical protein